MRANRASTADKINHQNVHPNDVVMPRSFFFAVAGGRLSKFSYKLKLQKRSFTSSILKVELSPIRTRPGSVRLGQTRKRLSMLRDLKRYVLKSSPTRASVFVARGCPTEEYRSRDTATPPKVLNEVRLV